MNTATALLLILSAACLGYLVVEVIRLDRNRRAIPLRIAVTGTRGKTSVARLLASVLREDGRGVLAKTTGSEARYVLPDGSEEEVLRLGSPSIIEQKRLLAMGARMGVDVVVAEIMSVHAENHQVEAQRILKPHLVLVTNFRVDHVEAQGSTREDVAAILALDVPPGSMALVPEKEWEDRFASLVVERGGDVSAVPAGVASPPQGCGEFNSNLDLVWEAARSLGVEDRVIREGICRSRGDLGALQAWRYPDGEGGARWIVVNAFAANDPESTLRIQDRVMAGEGLTPERCFGLLSLRSDRGDRTALWAEALKAGALEGFGRLFVTGLHAHALRHRLRSHPEWGRIEVLSPTHPQDLMRRILERGGGQRGLVFGFGNIGGLGESLVRHWRRVGEAHGV
jgi:gamma-polyglutamate synthase